MHPKVQGDRKALVAPAGAKSHTFITNEIVKVSRVNGNYINALLSLLESGASYFIRFMLYSAATRSLAGESVICLLMRSSARCITSRWLVSMFSGAF